MIKVEIQIFNKEEWSKADYNKAVSRGDIGQNFSAKPNFFEKIQDKAQTLSLKNLYDTKTGAKKMSPFAFANYVNSFNPALEVYESTDEDDIMRYWLRNDRKKFNKNR